jgi:hypothetical protein
MIDAFKYAYPDREASRLNVELHLAISPRLTTPYLVQVTGLSYESGAEGMFNFTGNLVGRSGTVKGFYDARRRQGIIDVTRSR